MNLDAEEFEKKWREIGVEICQAVYTKEETQKLKNALQKNGYLSLEEKSQFIDICDNTKYEVIYSRFGEPNTETYKEFSTAWQNWFKEKGVKSKQESKQESSVDHILYGSTPDPIQFLNRFEEEIMGSLASRKEQ